MTNNPLLLELNIALMPSQPLADQLAKTSRAVAKKYPARVQLDATPARLVMAPHLTLYQVPLHLKDMEHASDLLERIAAHTPVFSLTASEYLYNAGEASFEVDYETTDELVTMQTEVIHALNPLRGDLFLQRDPSGGDMRRFLTQQDRQGDDVRATGYWEVGDARQGGFFRPHATINWLELGTPLDITDPLLPAVHHFSGQYDNVGLFVLGPQGSCPQLLRRYSLTG
jgi:hypothetical protein